MIKPGSKFVEHGLRLLAAVAILAALTLPVAAVTKHGGVAQAPKVERRQAYARALYAHITRFKPSYPANRRLGGKVLLEFTLRRDGSIAALRIRQSSGYGVLDDAAIAMLKRAQPLPPLPP